MFQLSGVLCVLLHCYVITQRPPGTPARRPRGRTASLSTPEGRCARVGSNRARAPAAREYAPPAGELRVASGIARALGRQYIRPVNRFIWRTCNCRGISPPTGRIIALRRCRSGSPCARSSAGRASCRSPRPWPGAGCRHSTPRSATRARPARRRDSLPIR